MVKIGELTGLAEFMEAAKMESFSKAAENLGVSVAHISRSVDALEVRLALTLFQRTTRKVKLSDAGRSFFQRCLPLLEELSLIQKQVREVPSDLEGSIRISVAGRYSEQTLTPLVARFCLLHPKVQCDINFSGQRVDIVNENFDFAVRTGDLGNSSSMIARKIKTVPFVTLAGSKLVRSLEGLKTPGELDPALCLSHWQRDWKFRKKEKVLIVKPRGPIESNNGEALVLAAIEGVGVIQVPAYYGLDAVAKSELIPLWPDWQEPSGVTFNIVYAKQNFQPRRVRTLIDFILEHIHET